MICAPEHGVNVQRISLKTDSEQQAREFKWIECEKAGRDLGEEPIRRWVHDHWEGYLRARWIEHLNGQRFWLELKGDDFGLLQREYQEHAVLLDRILDRAKTGQENLDILIWAQNWAIPIDTVIEILEGIDINSRRLACHFGVS